MVEILVNTNLDLSKLYVGFGRRVAPINVPVASNELFNTTGTAVSTFTAGTAYCGGLVQLYYAHRDPSLNLGTAILYNDNLNVWISYDDELIDHVGFGPFQMNNFTAPGTPAYHTIPRAVSGSASHENGDLKTAGLIGSTGLAEFNTLSDYSTASLHSPGTVNAGQTINCTSFL